MLSLEDMRTINDDAAGMRAHRSAQCIRGAQRGQDIGGKIDIIDNASAAAEGGAKDCAVG